MTVDELKIRRRELMERRREEQRLQEEGCGDAFALFMAEEELLEVNAQLRSLTVGRRLGSRSSTDPCGRMVDKQLYKNWAAAQEDDAVCSKGAMLREILSKTDALMTKKQALYLREWSCGKTMEQIGREHSVNKSTVSRVIQRGKAKLQKAAEVSEMMQRQELPQIDLSNKTVAQVILNAVTPKQAVYLYLYYGEWLTLREIANLMGIRSHQSVMVSLRSALAKIGRTLQTEYAELINLQALDELAYSVYQSMEEHELVPPEAQKQLEKLQLPQKKYYCYRYVSIDKLPHMVMQRAADAEKEAIWLPLLHRYTQRCSGKLMQALLERRKAELCANGVKGTINSWLSAIFAKLKRCLRSKAGRNHNVEGFNERKI